MKATQDTRPRGRVWPWREPAPLRNTLSFVLPVVGLAAFLLWLLRGETSLVSWAWLLALVSTLQFGSALAATTGPFLRLSRVVWGFLMVLFWLLLYRAAAR